MPKFAQQAPNPPESSGRGRTQLRAETWVAVTVLWAVFCPSSCCGTLPAPPPWPQACRSVPGATPNGTLDGQPDAESPAFMSGHSTSVHHSQLLAAFSPSLILGTWRKEPRVGRTQNNVFPTWRPAPQNRSVSPPCPWACTGVSLNASAHTTTYTQGRSLLSTHWKAKNSPAPLGPCNWRRDSWFR